MFSLFSPKAELGVVFHIGSLSVGAGLIRFKKGELPHVIYSLRESYPTRDLVEPEKYVSDMISALKRINARIAKEGLLHLKFTEFGSLKVKHVYYGFSSPWSITQTKIATVAKPEGFTLTKEMVDKIVEEQEKLFETNTMGETKLSNLLHVVEKRVIQIKLNGYESSDPFGKRVERADISIFVSLIPKVVFDRVFDVSLSTYHPRDTNVFSFPLAAFSIIRDSFLGASADFMFLDVGGEVSEVSIVRDGLLLETISFPLGRNYIIRKVSRVAETSPEEAASLIRIYHEGHADENLEKKLEPILEQASQEWVAGFSSVLSKLSMRMALPTNLYAVIHNDFVSFFMKALKDEKSFEFVNRSIFINPTLVTPDKLETTVKFGKHAEKDAFIAIITAFTGRMYQAKADSA
jgi:hypothetical protein